WPDDTPVVGAQIKLLHPDERLRRGYDATTDERGRFTIEGVKDYEYKIRVYWSNNESESSEEEMLKFSGDVKDLKIVLSKQ
ncbi:MAG TPA: carboxypeptidase-like regulatory domain-containing protein, partial [Blastocatellia bacterium]|nr:carboxypeptidase-like regulatory domain-containing protein [Blastocatellia bacterium]